MRTMMFARYAAAMSLGLIPLVAGCESTEKTEKHEMASSSGSAMGCQACYDDSVVITQASAKGSQWDKHQIIKKHHCDDCKSEVTIYTEDGKPMIKCAHCAPKGVACDKCRPPKSRS